MNKGKEEEIEHRTSALICTQIPQISTSKLDEEFLNYYRDIISFRDRYILKLSAKDLIDNPRYKRMFHCCVKASRLKMYVMRGGVVDSELVEDMKAIMRELYELVSDLHISMNSPD